MKKTVYLKETGLGGLVLAEIGCDYLKVLWHDGTESVVNYTELETRLLERFIFWFPNLQLRIENLIVFLFEDPRLDALIIKLIAGGLIGALIVWIL